MKRSTPTTVFITLAIWASLLPVAAQDTEETSEYPEPKHKLYLGIESGIKIYESLDPGYDFIRQEASYYYGYYGSYSYISRMAYAPELTLKAEYRAFKDRLWVSSGLMYAPGYSSMRISGGDQDYFYLMLDQQTQESYYYRISSIESWDHRVGIPLDIRYSPFVPRVFRIYFKMGMDVLFNLASNQHVTFHDPAMEVYEEEVLDLFTQSVFYAAGSLGAGFQWGRQDKVQIRLEADFPTFLITPEAFALVKSELAGGVNLSVMVPFKSK